MTIIKQNNALWNYLKNSKFKSNEEKKTNRRKMEFQFVSFEWISILSLSLSYSYSVLNQKCLQNLFQLNNNFNLNFFSVIFNRKL